MKKYQLVIAGLDHSSNELYKVHKFYFKELDEIEELAKSLIDYDEGTYQYDSTKLSKETEMFMTNIYDFLSITNIEIQEILGYKLFK